MLETIVQILQGIPREAIVLIVAALPVSELRGAIPLALSFGFSLQKACLLSVLGNLLPIIPILFLLQPLSLRLRRLPVFARFFDWLFERTMKKSEQIQKYEMLGLIVFVGIPLPMTGAWTGAIAASLLKMKFRYAFTGCVLGVLLAAAIVAALSQTLYATYLLSTGS